jgi:hypothetical protein
MKKELTGTITRNTPRPLPTGVVYSLNSKDLALMDPAVMKAWLQRLQNRIAPIEMN